MDRCPVPRDLVELKKQIKAASDIVDVIAGYLPVHPAGKIFKCLCPFHDDKRPSMQVDRGYQNFHCWACGAKGDVFDFVEKYEKVAFKEAMAILARRAGIRMETDSPADTHKVRLFEVMRWAQAQYQRALLDEPVGAAAVKYIAGRQLSGKSVRDFGLGFAPIEGGWLTALAARDGISTELLVEVGLLGVRDADQGHWERFRDRVMFPIRDVQGRTVGFGGRILPDSPYAARAPKYYNSADTPLFSKSELLYGLDMARHAGAKAGFLAVVEGYTDVMMAHQCGITNVVATMGTALNARHVAQLRRYAPKVVLVFDADAGGTTGVDRALEIFVTQDVELAIATLPDGLDPCDLLSRPDGVERFRTAVEAGAVNAFDFKLNQLLSTGDTDDPEQTSRAVDAILGVIAMAPDIPSESVQIKRERIVTRLEQRFGLRQGTLWKRLVNLQQVRRRSEPRDATRQPVPMAAAARVTQPARPPAGPRAGLERQLLQILLAEPGFVPEAAQSVPADTIEHTGIRRIVTALYELAAAGEPPDLDGARLKLLDRPDLYQAALDNQQMGRGIPDRPLYLRKVLDGFARVRADAERRAVKEQLSVTGSDDPAVIERLREYQERSKQAPGADGPPRRRTSG
jgi:DNA primase